MSYDVTGLISERLNAIDSSVAQTTSEINQFVEEILRRRPVSFSYHGFGDFDKTVYPLPDLPTDFAYDSIHKIPTEINFPEHDVPSFNLEEFLSEFDDLLSQLEFDIDKPVFDELPSLLEIGDKPSIPDTLPPISDIVIDDFDLFAVNKYSSINLPELKHGSVEAPNISDDLISEFNPEKFVYEIKDKINKDLNFDYYSSELIERQRNRIDRLISFYQNVISTIKNTSPLDRAKVLDKIIAASESKERQYFRPLYDYFGGFLPDDVKSSAAELVQQASNLLKGKIKEEFFSENVFTDQNREFEFEEIILSLRKELDEYENIYVNASINLWNTVLSYMVLGVTKWLIDLDRRKTYEDLLIQIYKTIYSATEQYYALYMSAPQAQVDYYRTLHSKSESLLNRIKSILNKNAAKIESYSAQINALNNIIKKYDLDGRLYSSKVKAASVSAQAAEAVYRNNQSKLDLYNQINNLISKFYSIRRTEADNVYQRSKAISDQGSMISRFDSATAKLLEQFHNLYGDISKVDVRKYEAELTESISNDLLKYRSIAEINTRRVDMLQKAYSVYLMVLLKTIGEIKRRTLAMTETSNNLALTSFRPLSRLSSGLLSSVDAVVNGLYEYVLS